MIIFEILFTLHVRFHQSFPIFAISKKTHNKTKIQKKNCKNRKKDLDSKNFLQVLIGLLDGENEPYCLLKAFKNIKEFLSTTNLSNAILIESDLFNVLCGYFPLSFEEEIVTEESIKRKLSKLLRICLAMSCKANIENTQFFLGKYKEFDEVCFKVCFGFFKYIIFNFVKIECVLVLNLAAKISEENIKQRDIFFSMKYCDFLVNEVCYTFPIFAFYLIKIKKKDQTASSIRTRVFKNHR